MKFSKLIWNKNQHPWDTMCTNFQTKWTTFSFWAKFAQKLILGRKFQKSKSGFGISILEILSAPICRQNRQLWIFAPKFAQKWILESEFKKSKFGFGIGILEILCTNFQTKWTTLDFWAQICPKMNFGVGISKVYVWIRNQHLQNTTCANFQSKWITFNFLA